MASATVAEVTAAQWWEVFPPPQSQCPLMEPAALLELLDTQATSLGGKRDFLLVDVRRNDWEGGTITSSINLPAQTLYQTRRIIYELCVQGGIKRVIFYCGSSRGRGPRCANWMQDFIVEMGAQDQMEAVVLTGGIKGWVKRYGGQKLDFYEEKYWEEAKSCDRGK